MKVKKSEFYNWQKNPFFFAESDHYESFPEKNIFDPMALIRPNFLAFCPITKLNAHPIKKFFKSHFVEHCDKYTLKKNIFGH